MDDIYNFYCSASFHGSVSQLHLFRSVYLPRASMLWPSDFYWADVINITPQTLLLDIWKQLKNGKDLKAVLTVEVQRFVFAYYSFILLLHLGK